MTKLEDEIEAMRLNMVNGHQEAIERLEHLELELSNCDGEIYDKLEDMKKGLRERRGEIVKSLVELHQMIATHPAIRQSTPPPINTDKDAHFQRIAVQLNRMNNAEVGEEPPLGDRFLSSTIQ